MARYFSGSPTYLAIGDNAALTIGDNDDYSGPFSFAGWLRAAGMADGNAHRFLGWGSASPLFQAFLYGSTHATAAGRIGIHLQSGQDIWYLPTDYNGWGDGAWRHFAFIGDGTTLCMYHDGVASSQTASMATLDAIDRADAFYIGRDPVGTPSYYFNGDLAEWAKWDAALSSEEIAALAAGVRPVDIENRPAWYLPMFDALHEEIEGLAVTDSGTTPAEHPPAVIRPGTPRVLRAIRPAVGGPYQVAALAAHASGAAEGEIFSTGTMIGQIHGY